MEQEGWMYPGVDTERPNAARVYDALLGGTHNFGVDRAVARNMTAIEPGMRDVARANRAFLGRAVRFLADFDQPVGLLLVAVLHFIREEEKPAERTPESAASRDARAGTSESDIYSRHPADRRPDGGSSELGRFLRFRGG